MIAWFTAVQTVKVQRKQPALQNGMGLAYESGLRDDQTWNMQTVLTAKKYLQILGDSDNTTSISICVSMCGWSWATMAIERTCLRGMRAWELKIFFVCWCSQSSVFFLFACLFVFFYVNYNIKYHLYSQSCKALTGPLWTFQLIQMTRGIHCQTHVDWDGPSHMRYP